MLPDSPIALKGSRAFFFDCIEEKRDDGVFCNVGSNISLCIKGSHFFLIDTPFKNVDKYVRRDYVFARRSLAIQLPEVHIEEGEYVLECFVRNLDGIGDALNLMLIEKINVKERYITCNRRRT